MQSQGALSFGSSSFGSAAGGFGPQEDSFGAAGISLRIRVCQAWA